AKNVGRDAAKEGMRDFANSSVRYNKRVDDETKERLLNGKRDPTRTDVPDPTEIVAFTLENAGYLQIMVKHPPRPPRYNGAVARYKVGGSPPANHKELTESKLLTRPHEIITFDDEALGQTLYIALYWQNEKGRLGPPSPIQSHVIA
ncbi:MAG: hypothetical protein LBO67_06315, partial [Spirochaetaceae bacterium]|nr:hypothetical protein [Spirochaetaceae bacterium]